MTNYARVQSALGIMGHTVPGAITLSSAPTAGNHLVAAVGVNMAPGTYTVGTGWDQIDEVTYDESRNPVTVVILKRKVQPGDTATLPAFFSAGTTWWSYGVQEVSGGSGTFINDFVCGLCLNDAALVRSPLPPKNCIANGSIALLFTANYNGNINPSVTGSWTMDDTANNNVNFGSASNSHRLMNSGDTIDGTLTVNSSPSGGYIIILSPSPSVTTRVRRSWSYTLQPSGTPGSFTLPFTPEISELILLALGWGDGSVASPTIDTGWTEIASAVGGTGKMLILVARTFRAGDTATLPNLVASGSTYYTIDILEVFGSESGIVSTKTGFFSSTGVTYTTTADTTTAANQLGVLFTNNAVGAFGYATATGFENEQRLDFSTGTNRRSWSAYSKEVAASSTSVQATVTPAGPSHPNAYIQAIIGPGAGGEVSQIGLAAWADVPANSPKGRVGQIGVEAWSSVPANNPTARVSQVGLEAWAAVPANVPSARVSQIGLEVWAAVPVGPGKLYTPNDDFRLSRRRLHTRSIRADDDVSVLITSGTFIPPWFYLNT